MTSTDFTVGGMLLVEQRLYTVEQNNGVKALVISAAISLVAVVLVLVLLGLASIKSMKNPAAHTFTRTHVAAYFVSLLLCDLLQAVGSLMNVKWIAQGLVQVGDFCTTQAIIKQTGNVGAAIFSFVIAVHTFNVLFFGWHVHDYVCYGSLILTWSVLGFVVTLGPVAMQDLSGKGPFYGIAGYWCWISPNYPTQRYTMEYLFMFASAFLSFILYTLVFFRLRGNIVVSGWRVYLQRSPASDDERRSPSSTSNASLTTLSTNGRKEKHIKSVARGMLWYPVVYTILILPIAAARLSEFAGKTVPFEVTIFAGTIFMLSGFVNAVLFFTTRRVITLREATPTWLEKRVWRSTFDETIEADLEKGYGRDLNARAPESISDHKDYSDFDTLPITPLLPRTRQTDKKLKRSSSFGNLTNFSKPSSSRLNRFPLNPTSLPRSMHNITSTPVHENSSSSLIGLMPPTRPLHHSRASSLSSLSSYASTSTVALLEQETRVNTFYPNSSRVSFDDGTGSSVPSSTVHESGSKFEKPRKAPIPPPSQVP